VRREGTDRSAEDQLRDREVFTYKLFKHTAALERGWLLAEVERNPENGRSVFFLHRNTQPAFSYTETPNPRVPVCA
jgi:hypothetical protein